MIALTVLASGSMGNCAALQVGDGRLILIDAGISPRATRQRLSVALSRAPEEATDIVLTHLDSDHYRTGWNRMLRRHPMRVRVHHRHLAAALDAGIPEQSISVFDGDLVALDLGGGLFLTPLRTPHDDRGTTALAFEWRSSDGSDDVVRIGYATDLGRVPEALFQGFDDLDVLAIESNYDHGMQVASSRPAFLKSRIMGGRGHLSNEQSLTAALRVSRAGDLRAIVLLHLSRECNCPEMVRRLWQERAAHLAERLVVSSQFTPTMTIVAQPRRRRERVREPLLFAAI